MTEFIQQEQEVDNKDEYVRRLSVACCSEGTKDFRQYLNLPKDHGVYFQDEEFPLLNANDHQTNEHIMHFGRCRSNLNPKNIASLLCMTSVVGIAAMVVKDVVGSSGCKCCPRTLRSWEVENKENHLDGAPAVARSSELVCAYGGIITITDEPSTSNEDENQNTQEEIPEETNILDTLPVNMADKIQQMNSDADAMAAEAMEWYAENEDMLMQLYACTDAMSMQNYANNCTQVIPMECMNAEGYITDSTGLTNFNVAGGNVAAIGSGCVAAFNALQALGSPMGLADVIMGMEQQQTVNGFIDQGPVGVSMCGIASMLMGQGFEVDMSFPSELTMDTLELQDGEIALIGAIEKYMMFEDFTYSGEEQEVPMSFTGEVTENVTSLQQGEKSILRASNKERRIEHCSAESMRFVKRQADNAKNTCQSERTLVSASKRGMQSRKISPKDFAKHKKGISRKESLCTIIPREKRMICAEQPDKPITEVFMEKADSTLMVMKAKRV